MEGSHLLHSHHSSLGKPLNSTHSEACAPLDVTIASSKRWLIIYSLLFVLAYLVLGVAVYTALSGMSVLDSLYFCIGERDRNNFLFLARKKWWYDSTTFSWYGRWYTVQKTVWCMVHGAVIGVVWYTIPAGMPPQP